MAGCGCYSSDLYPWSPGQSRGRWKADLEGEFPSSLVVRTPCPFCRGHRFDSWSGNWDPICWMVQTKKNLIWRGEAKHDSVDVKLNIFQSNHIDFHSLTWPDFSSGFLSYLVIPNSTSLALWVHIYKHTESFFSTRLWTPGGRALEPRLHKCCMKRNNI